jgi:hypothetical protein
MVSVLATTIKINPKTRDLMKKMGHKQESYDQIIQNLLKFKQEHDHDK